ncbi:retrovirus-related pol polyprotein from transposon TNT 1-94 [Tanacetum coccineum]|uniref:Retrovirus-related pol polyprotein from transposon TNT 1-94 n=1 Tax=Tanacetum coccineum TaxID=301880 RepID=A0ABQ5IDP4_9ASTR
MSMMGELKFFLGLQVHQSPRGIFISQSQYAIELLKKHGLDECVSMSTPMAIERLDVDLQGSPTDQTTYHQAEYVSLSTCCAQVIWMHTQLLDYGFKYNRIPMYCDSKSTIAISCNPVQHSKTKHIDIRITEFELVIIMAQQQHAADVHPDELCPPNKRYDLMDANKKVELEHVQCPSESKILMNIIKNHPLRFSIAASASVPWIYMAQFWHTLKEDGSKHRLKFLLDRKRAYIPLDGLQNNLFIFHKPWQTLCKIFSKCLTTRVTGWDQPPLQIMQMLYCFVNNIHVDYAELMWEGIYYSLHHPATSIPYPRFTKIIISHYMTIFPDISRRARDAYHNLQDDDIMKNIFNSGRNKNKVGMRIPAWMITDEMKLTEHYKMYAEVVGLDVPLNQSQPTESTQGTYRTPNAPRSPNRATETAESSVPKRSTVIRFRLPSRQSTRLTPPVSVPSVEKSDEMILQDMIQVSLAEHKSREEQEARENVALVYEHLAAEEIEKLVEDPENVDDSSPKGNDLLTGSRGTDLYSITLQDSTTPNPICLMAKATSSQAWLWHRRLSHLNFDTINLLSKNNIVNGLPKLKFVKDHLCSSCELGKAKRKSFHTKTTPSSKRRLQLLHMDLCGLMRVESINGKKYVLVIVDDYSRYTWTHFLRSKDETPRVLIDFLTLVQRGLHAQVTTVRTDKGT